MKPEERFNASIVSLSIFLLTLILKFAFPKIEKLLQSNPLTISFLQKPLTIPNIVIESLLSIIVSYGLYLFLANTLKSQLIKVAWIKKTFFGQYYLEGTWIGHYISQDKQYLNYAIEKIYQIDFNSLLIVGSSYEISGEQRGDWKSSSYTLNISDRELIYSYNHELKGLGDPVMGLAKFQLLGGPNDNNFTERCGFSIDKSDLTTSPSWMKKISDSIEPDNSNLIVNRIPFWKKLYSTLLNWAKSLCDPPQKLTTQELLKLAKNHTRLNLTDKQVKQYFSQKKV